MKQVALNAVYFNRCAHWGFPGASVVKNLPAKQKTSVRPTGWKIPWRRKWQPIPVLLSGKSHAQRSLTGYSPQAHKSETQLSD